MPGHKRRLSGDILNQISQIDMTEIDGFDNLHDAEGILKDAQERAARLYGAEESFFLVNGSTCGILSAVGACVPAGGWLLMARNCHKSVYHAAILGNLKTTYLYPSKDSCFNIYRGISVADIEQGLTDLRKGHPGKLPDAVIITSPAYEGAVSDIEGIAGLLHSYGIPLIVDEAHGAHFGMAEELPGTSCRTGADLIIHSTHKTLPALTQTALLHVNGCLVDRRRLKRYLGIYQTSSPSYVLMASIDRAVMLMQTRGREYFRLFFDRKEQMSSRLQRLQHLAIWQEPGADPLKLVVSTHRTGISGKQLYDMLREEFALQMEMAAGSYVIAILSVMDSQEGFDRLTEALLTIDRRLTALQENAKEKVDEIEDTEDIQDTEAKYSLAEALEKPVELIVTEVSEGRICGDFIYVYPPGIPLLAPGEKITGKHIKKLLQMQKQGLTVKGISEGRIQVLAE